MRIAGAYSFKNGKNHVEKKYPELLKEIRAVIAAVSAKKHLTKESKEKTMPGKMLSSPSALNEAIKQLACIHTNNDDKISKLP